MSYRPLIEHAVFEQPGMTFTELKEKVGLENGVIQYHIHKSDVIEQKKGVIVPYEFCDGCSLKTQCRTRCVLKLLEDPVKHRIVTGLRNGEPQQSIAEAVGLDKSTISYHITQLEHHGVLMDKEPAPEVTRFLDRSSVVYNKEKV